MVDTKCNYLNTKYKKIDSNTSDSNVFVEDESLLRQPLRTSSTGFSEAKKAYENGTDEVRQLLLEECSLIYECNMCRNMYRSLANFISHKHNYCKIKTAENFRSFPDSNRSVIIQTVDRPESWLSKNQSNGSSPISGLKSSSRDLSKVIERLKHVEVTSECSNDNNLTMEYKINTSMPEPKAPDPVLELQHVSTTAHAVYQTLKTINDSYSIKTELDEVKNLLTNQQTLVGLDGNTIKRPTYMSLTTSDNNGLEDNNYKATNFLPGIICEICKIPFQTEKTLKMHVQKKHTSTTYVFQCPTCSMTFLQPAAVIRHLANEHKKPLRRIRKMRDTILKRRIQIGDVQKKRHCGELKTLQLSNPKDLDDSNNLNDQNGKSLISCIYCGKNFERRAALKTHLAKCLMRQTSKDNNIKFSKLLEISNGDSKEKKEELHNQILSQNLRCSINNDKIMNMGKYEDPVNIKQEIQNGNHALDNSNINELFASLGNQSFGKGLQTVSLEKLEMLVETKENDEKQEEGFKKEKETQKTNSVKKEKSKRFRIMPTVKQLTCRCKICNKQFNALSNLRRHISMFHYRSKRFGCNLCEYRAFRRYDIVNHLTFVHKMTGERESMAIEYVTVHEIKYTKDDVEGDIVVVNEEMNAPERNKTEEQQQIISEELKFTQETTLKTYEKREKRKNILLQSNKVQIDGTVIPKDVSHVKIVRRKFKKSVEQKVESQKRPIRNRIKAVNKDFVYDLLTIKEESKKQSRIELKRRNTIFVDQNNLINIELKPPPIKITPYRLRTEPLMPADKNMVKGHATNIFRNAIHQGLASPSTLPDLPTQRPQMRSRLISASRSDSNTVPIIETTELEAARLKSTFVDDSFLERLARTSNSSFKMKPLLALQHSPLDSILQKFDATKQQNNNDNNIQNINFLKLTDKALNSRPNYNTISPLETLMQSSFHQKNDFTPNGKDIVVPSPPTTPKKRITLMQRLAENRAKRRDSLIRTTLEN